MAKIEQKQTVVNAIKENVEGAQSVVLVDYRGLTVEEDTELRKNLREAGVTYKVYKNTMMRFAFEGTEFEGLSKHLSGPSAIAISKEDATVPARVINDTAKKYPSLEFKAGVVEGQYYDEDGIKQIASIPPREELLGKLLGSLQSPIVNFARVIKQISEKDNSEEVATE
ncbi:MAG: 50S ribosomal protein L10 [Eubacteriales bacterium]